MVMASEVPGWELQQRPAQLTRRFEFATYSDTRAFLDELTTLSAETGLYPDLNFGKTYVNVTIAGPDDALGKAEYDLAERINALAQGGAA